MTKKLKKQIKKLVDETTRQLRWPVEYVYDDHQDVQMAIKPLEQKYIITLPATRENRHEFRRLHELGHALFYQKYGVGSDLVRSKTLRDKANLDVLSPVLRAAGDWFLEAWISKLVPEAGAEDTEETLNTIRENVENRPAHIKFDSFFAVACILAEGIHFYHNEPHISADLQRAVDVFLSVSPYLCSIENEEKLANKLIEEFEFAFQVKATESEGFVYWDYRYGKEREEFAARPASAPPP